VHESRVLRNLFGSRRRKYVEARENYKMRYLIVSTAHKILVW
jgi:hypothetical protein